MRKFLKFIKNCLITAIVIVIGVSVIYGWLTLVKWLNEQYGWIPAIATFIAPFVIFGGLLLTSMGDE